MCFFSAESSQLFPSFLCLSTLPPPIHTYLARNITQAQDRQGSTAPRSSTLLLAQAHCFEMTLDRPVCATRTICRRLQGQLRQTKGQLREIQVFRDISN